VPSLESRSSDLAARLWTQNQDLAQACLRHAFIRRLATGSLPVKSFKAYVAQDANFLEAFARAYAFALARSPDRAGLEAFHSLIGGVLAELHLHARYAARWEVDLTEVEPAAATLAYTDFLLATAGTRGLGEICAAMTPCMRLYAYLGQSLAAEGAAQSTNPYCEWIETYASPEFDSLAATLEGLLNRYAHDTPTVSGTYRRALRLELGFFAAAYLQE
jgi:thiaminase/transcriptional activator TenA